MIDELQSKFKVTDGSAFTELVNFKNNKKIPKHNWYEYKQGYAEDLVKQIGSRGDRTTVPPNVSILLYL